MAEEPLEQDMELKEEVEDMDVVTCMVLGQYRPKKEVEQQNRRGREAPVVGVVTAELRIRLWRNDEASHLLSRWRSWCIYGSGRKRIKHARRSVRENEDKNP